MTALTAAASLYALFVLVRYLPRLYRGLLRRGATTADRTGAVVAALNVVLALLILAAAVKALASALI